MAPKKVCRQLAGSWQPLTPFQRIQLTPEEVKKEEERWQKDVKQVGKATCPVCGLELGYGPGGIVNLIGQHLHTERCDEAKAKRDKQPRENGSMLNFFAPKLPCTTYCAHTSSGRLPSSNCVQESSAGHRQDVCRTGSDIGISIRPGFAPFTRSDASTAG
jgi:hypothetical protein